MKTTTLGALITAAFDEAARLSSDGREVARLATGTVTILLGSARRVAAVRHPAHGFRSWMVHDWWAAPSAAAP